MVTMATRGPVSTIQRSDIVPLRQRPQLGDGRCRRPLRALRLVNVLALLMRTARGQRPPRTWRTAPKGLADDHAIVKYTRSKVQARAKLPRRMWMPPAAPRPQPVFEHTQRQHGAQVVVAPGQCDPACAYYELARAGGKSVTRAPGPRWRWAFSGARTFGQASSDSAARASAGKWPGQPLPALCSRRAARLLASHQPPPQPHAVLGIAARCLAHSCPDAGASWNSHGSQMHLTPGSGQEWAV